MSAPTVIQTATLSFGSDSYKVKSIPGDKPKTCEPVDVTCCDDSRKQFSPGALVANGDISVVVAGNSAPSINAKASLSQLPFGSVPFLKIVLDTGSVDCGLAVVSGVEPSTIEADNARERTWTVTFRPCGAEPPAVS